MGKRIPGRRKKVDEFGDNLATTSMRGDGWRRQHDAIKWTMHDLWVRFGGDVTCEVTTLFALPFLGWDLYFLFVLNAFIVRHEGGEGEAMVAEAEEPP